MRSLNYRVTQPQISGKRFVQGPSGNYELSYNVKNVEITPMMKQEKAFTTVQTMTNNVVVQRRAQHPLRLSVLPNIVPVDNPASQRAALQIMNAPCP
jgi:hypothetical protein